MYVCIYVYIYIYTYICSHTHTGFMVPFQNFVAQSIHTYIHTIRRDCCMYTCIYVYIYTYICSHTQGSWYLFKICITELAVCKTHAYIHAKSCNRYIHIHTYAHTHKFMVPFQTFVAQSIHTYIHTYD